MVRAKSSLSRILQVVHGFPPDGRGGTESYVLEATLALRATGHDVSVLSGSMEPRNPAGLSTAKVHGIPVTRLHRSGIFLDNWEKSYDPAAATLFEEVLAEARPDVVHVHHWIRLTRNLVETAAARGIPAIVTLHDAMTSCPRVFRVREETLCHRPLSIESCLHCVPRDRTMADAECGVEIESYRRDFERELDLAARVIVPSRAHRDFLSRELKRPREFFEVVPHGKLERGRPSLAALRRVPGRIRLGHWGHLAVHKGYHLLLEALQELSEAERDRFEVVCFGTAADPEYRRRLDALSKGVVVTEVGEFTPKDLGRFSFDVAVLPSIASESFSFVLDEAFELGVPALVSDRGALAERLGDAGMTFEPESPKSLATRLRSILADPSVIGRWAAAIPALIPMKEHAQALARIYRDVARARHAPVAVDPAVVASRLARLSNRLSDRTRALEVAESVADDLQAQLEKKDADVAAFRKSIADHERLLAEKSEVLGGFERSIADYRQELARREAALVGFEDTAALHQAELARRDVDLAAFQKSVADYKREVRARDERLDALEGAARARETESRTWAARIGDLERAVADRESQIARRDEAIASFQESVAEYQSEVEQRDEDLAGFQRSTAELRAEVARLGGELRDQAAAHSESEAAWKRSLEEHRRSLDLHAASLVSQARESERLKARWDTLAAAFDVSKGKLEESLRQARSLAAEVSDLQAAAAVAREAQACAEREAALLDRARAEEQKQIAAWRERAVRAEAARESSRRAQDATTASLAGVRARLDEVTRQIRGLEDDARRMADLQSQALASLAVPVREDGDRLAGAADLASAVVTRQAKIDELRAWLRASNGGARPAEVLRRLDELPRRLRILQVIHDFLPYHAAGSEVYTYQLAKALGARHDVELAFCENRPDRVQYEVRRGTYDGIPFTEVVHHAAWPDFRSTYVDARMEARFDEILDRFQPDVVHVQHTKFFGVGILRRAAKRHLPIVYTLHEYMLLCARDGQLLKADLERCDLPEPGKCAECMAPRLVESGALSRGAQKVGRGLARVLPGALKEIGTRIERRAAVRHSDPVDGAARRRLIEERDETVREALKHVDLFLAPSEFLRRTFIASGFVSAERIVVSRYGQDLTRFPDAPKAPSPTLRVGYLGTVAAYKGVEVLVDALNRLTAHPVEGRIHGVTEFFPDFVEALQARIANPRVRILGRYENKDVGRILSEMDVLVVPSLWWENSPITIHEAFQAGVPVVASDQGGMAEMVQNGKNGFLFKTGDAADLARVLMRFVADPGLAAALRPRRESIRDIREDALWTEDQYRRLVAAKAGQ